RALLEASVAAEAKAVREALARESVRLGRAVAAPAAAPGKTREVWEEGWAAREWAARGSALLVAKEALDKEKRELAKEKRDKAKRDKAAAGGGPAGAAAGAAEGEQEDEEAFELLGREEGLKARAAQHKRQEAQHAEEKRQLEREKAAHARALKRAQLEGQSRFSKASERFLNGRYFLTRLLGRGGFSEVWAARDLKDPEGGLREVAVKVHQLNSAWSEDRKESYIKHATREYTIHSAIDHPRVVRLWDVFEISSSAFATVLEFCAGPT
ncbi:unnamed protein product, partial [Heterosigma akashiwo]